MIYGIFTKGVHVEKLSSYLGKLDVDFVISTRKDNMYREDFDVGISYCYPFIVDVDRDKRPWFNYHPAPLPEYPSVSCIVSALNDKVVEYGVTLHRMTNVVDRGRIVERLMFSLYSVPVDANELGSIAHYYLFQLFKKTIGKLGDI